VRGAGCGVREAFVNFDASTAALAVNITPPAIKASLPVISTANK